MKKNFKYFKVLSTCQGGVPRSGEGVLKKGEELNSLPAMGVGLQGGVCHPVARPHIKKTRKLTKITFIRQLQEAEYIKKTWQG